MGSIHSYAYISFSLVQKILVPVCPNYSGEVGMLAFGNRSKPLKSIVIPHVKDGLVYKAFLVTGFILYEGA